MSQSDFETAKADVLKQLDLRATLVKYGTPVDKRQEQLAELGGAAVRSIHSTIMPDL